MAWNLQKYGSAVLVQMNTSKANAMNETFFQDLNDAFDRLEKEFPEAPVVLTGEGGIFCAGLDFHYTFPIFASGDQKRIEEWFDRFRATMLRVLKYPNPTVAAMNGHAFAGGLILGFCCDFRLVAQKTESRFALNEVPIGIPMPSVYVEVIRHILGSNITNETILLGRRYTVQEGLDLRFFNQIIESENLITESLKLSQEVSSECLAAYQFSKKGIQAPLLKNIEEISMKIDREIAFAFSSKGGQKAQQEALERLKK